MPSSSPTPTLSLGIDIGGTSAKLALLRDGEVIHAARSEPYDNPSLDEVWAKVIAIMPADARTHVHRVGLCVPGIVDCQQRYIEKSLNLPGIQGVSLDALVNHVMGRPGGAIRPRLLTDAYAAAYDFWHSHARPMARVLAISLGTGVGAAVLDAGEPLIVSGQGPGHIGAMDVSGLAGSEVPQGRDGARGTLEAYIGLPALRARLGANLRGILPTLKPDSPPVSALVRAIRVCHAVYRPQHVALLGGVGMALAGLCPAIRDAVADGLTSLAREDWTLRPGITDLHAAIGAARLALAE